MRNIMKFKLVTSMIVLPLILFFSSVSFAKKEHKHDDFIELVKQLELAGSYVLGNNYISNLYNIARNGNRVAFPVITKDRIGIFVVGAHRVTFHKLPAKPDTEEKWSHKAEWEGGG